MAILEEESRHMGKMIGDLVYRGESDYPPKKQFEDFGEMIDYAEDAAVDNVIREYLKLLRVGEHCLEDSVQRQKRFIMDWRKDADTVPKLVFENTFKMECDEMIVIRRINLASMCEHHLIPFTLVADIAYFPSPKGVLGVSKFARIVRHFAHKPQLQERLTVEIADFLEQELETQDIAVRIVGQHLCAKIRGVEQANMDFVTQVVRGKFRENDATRAEFLKQIG